MPKKRYKISLQITVPIFPLKIAQFSLYLRVMTGVLSGCNRFVNQLIGRLVPVLAEKNRGQSLIDSVNQTFSWPVGNSAGRLFFRIVNQLVGGIVIQPIGRPVNWLTGDLAARSTNQPSDWFAD